MISTRVVLSTSHILIRCRDPRGDEIRTGEVCVLAAGEWQGAKLELFAKFRKNRAGRSGILCCGTDKDGRHDILHEITRHGPRVSCHDTKEHDHAHSKHHASARRASTCHAMVWLHFASHAQHFGTDLAQSETGKRGVHEEPSLSHARPGVQLTGCAAV